MACAHIAIPDGNGGIIRGIVCGLRVKRCKCGKKADRECDWKVVKRGKPATCDKGVCFSCSVSPAPEKDLCQKHAAMWAADPRNPARSANAQADQLRR
jgi:hypothetical protein